MNQPSNPNSSSKPSDFYPKLHREKQNAEEEYRRAVKEQIAKGYEYNERNISPGRREILEATAKKLGISQDQAVIIEAKELKPYHDYQENFQNFKRKLREVYKDSIDNISHKNRDELKELQEALKLPDLAVALAHLSLGQDLRKEDKLEEALKQVEEAIHIVDKLAEAFEEKGVILQQQGMKSTNISQKRRLRKEAIESYEKAQKIFEQEHKKDQSNEIECLIKKMKKSNSDNLLKFYIQILLEKLYTPKLNEDFLKISSSKNNQEGIQLKDEENFSLRKEYYRAVEGKTMAERPNISNYDLKNAKIAAFAGTGGQASGTFNDYSANSNLSQAAAEIQQLLNQLSATNSTTTTAEKMAVVAKVADTIEKNQGLKQKVIAALEAGNTELLKQAINHPLAKNLIPILEEWSEAAQ